LPKQPKALLTLRVLLVAREQDIFGMLGSNNIHGWNIHTGDAVFVLLAVILRHPDQGKILNLQPMAFGGGRKLETPMWI